MAINLGSVISNAKGAANIAQLKVTLGLKTNELNKVYAELGKLFYEWTNNNQPKDVESVCEDALSSETENINSSPIDYMADEKICDCLKKIPSLEQEIAALESQVSNQKDSMKPIVTPVDPVPSGNGQSNYSQGPVEPAESGAKCPKCGAVQSSDNEFCMFCGMKMSE